MTGQFPGDDPSPQRRDRRGGHGWMMIACCIPMLVIGIVLVATGAVQPRFLVFAVGCTVMMALMMRGMTGMNHDNTHGTDNMRGNDANDPDAHSHSTPTSRRRR